MDGTSGSWGLTAAELPGERWLSRPLTWLGQAVDAAVVQAMRVVVEKAVMPSPERFAAMLAAAAPYTTESLEREPARFFACDEAARVPVHATTRVRGGMAGGTVLRHRLGASLAPFAGAPLACDEIRVEHWAHPGRPHGVVLAVHGFGMGHPPVDALVLLASTWFRHGLDVALLTLPYHGRRTPPGSRFSGERFAAAEPGTLNEAVRRALFEMQVVRRWLGALVQAPVGLLGLSLGGYLAAVAAGLDADLPFVVAMVPPVCFGDLAWRFAPARRDGRAPAVTRDDLRRLYRVHSPLSHPPRVPRERLLVVAGRGDRVVPPEHPHALWRHWGRPAIHWYSGGHLTPFGRRTVGATVLAHLRGLGFGCA